MAVVVSKVLKISFSLQMSDHVTVCTEALKLCTECKSCISRKDWDRHSGENTTKHLEIIKDRLNEAMWASTKVGNAFE